MTSTRHRGHSPPSLNESDFSLDHNVDANADLIDGDGQLPLKSTLLAGKTPSGNDPRRVKQMRARIPDALMFKANHKVGHTKAAQREGNTDGYLSEANVDKQKADDVTLSTQQSDSILDAIPSHHLAHSRQQQQRLKAGARERSVPGAALGQNRPVRMQVQTRPDQYSGFNEHPSPSTAARQNRLRGKLPTALVNTLALADSEDSESAAESSTSSDTVDAAPHDPFNKFRSSLGESTGNHEGFMKSPEGLRNGAKVVKRPNLAPGWQTRLDELNDGRKKTTGCQPSMPILHRAKSAFNSEQERRPSSPYHPSARNGAAEEVDALEAGSNESGYAAGSQRKTSNASSKDKVRSSADASTSGETMVDGRAGPLANHFWLPSGQQMGKGVPSNGFSLPADLSGLTMALESPAKSRLGVEHREIVPEQVHAYAAATSDMRLHDVEEVAHLIRTVNEKADRANDVSRDAVREVGSLRKEWSSWKGGQHDDERSKPKVVHTAPSMQQTPFDVGDANQYRSKLANAHKMATEIGESMESYRATLAELKREEKELLAREFRRSQAAAHAPLRRMQETARSLPTTSLENDNENGEDDVDSLRAQVEAVAREVERLRQIVNRQTDGKRVYSASSPIKPPMRHDGRLQSVSNGGNPFVQHRKVSDGSKVGVQDRPMMKLLHAHKGASSPPLGVPRKIYTTLDGIDMQQNAGKLDREGGDDEDEEEGNETARPRLSPDPADTNHQINATDIRAHRAIEKVIRISSERHNSQQCTHCTRQGEHKHRSKSHYKNAAVQHEWNGYHAKPRRSSSSSERQDEESEARTLLEEALLELENYVGARLPPALLQLANKQRALLERTIQEELDDFFHARETYGDMADELKSISPDMSAANRRVLSDHVRVSISELDVRATRIDRLRAALAATLPGSLVDNDATSPVAARPVVSRSKASSTRSQRGQRLRNSPPIVDDDDHDEAHVGSYDDCYHRRGLD